MPPTPTKILTGNHSSLVDFPNSLFAYLFFTLYEKLQIAWAPSPTSVSCAVVLEAGQCQLGDEPETIKPSIAGFAL